MAFGLIALAAAYWSIVRDKTILARDDNPRLVEAELKIHRGSIVDINSQPLALSSDGAGESDRYYPLPSAAPAVGYYSLRYGTAGVEEAYDAYLRGESDDFWSNLWHIELLGEPQSGRDLRLTIDSRWQEMASDLLGEQSGAVLLFTLPDVAIRAMASSPGYDPNTLDSDFEQLVADENAPLLNRVTQGQYQPGLLLQPFILAAASGDNVIDLQEAAQNASEAVTVDGVSQTCQAKEEQAQITWAGALKARCPGPMVWLGQEMGAAALMDALELFGLTQSANLLAAPEAAGAAQIDDVRLAAIGQDRLAVNPLQIGVALATLVNDGQPRPARLVTATEDDSGDWRAIRPEEPGAAVLPSRIRQQILAAFSQNDGVLEHEVTVLSGPEGGLNSWYLGLAPAAEPRYGVVVVVENNQGANAASVIGRLLLKAMLDPALS
jgi:peptidoglycan glycosyltransferase